MSRRVHASDGNYWIDRREKLGSIIPNEIILYELRQFLSRHYSSGAERLLDIGAGTKPYERLYGHYFRECTSVDVPYSPSDLSRVDVLASVEDLPFSDESFDCIVCTEVLEHCEHPRAAMSEIGRVLKAGGRAFVTTPFLVAEHEMPHDYYRYTSSALRSLAGEAGLIVCSTVPKGDYIAVAFSTLLFPWSKFWQAASTRLELDLYHPYNPLVFFPIVLPQLIYVSIWKRFRVGKGGSLRRLHEKLSYVTLGYVTTLVKPPDAPDSSRGVAAT
jgi:SAM-dependent methyltransferase